MKTHDQFLLDFMYNWYLDALDHESKIVFYNKRLYLLIQNVLEFLTLEDIDQGVTNVKI